MGSGSTHGHGSRTQNARLVGPQQAIRSPNFRVYDSFVAPMQMIFVKQVSLRSDGVVRKGGGREELTLAFSA
jgi:hypothetical protein